MSRTGLLAFLAAVFLLLATGSARAQSVPDAPAINSVTAGAGSLTVAWSAPANNGGSTITAYDLRYILSDATSKADDQWTKVDAWSSGTLQYQLTGLRDQTSYDVQVRAENIDGEGAWSPASTQITSDHGDARTAATTITLGSPVPGRLDTEEDEDYFAITLTSGAYLWIYTTGLVDTRGELYRSNGSPARPLSGSRSTGHHPHGTENFSISSYLNAGTYYVSVESRVFKTKGTASTGPYTLHVVAAPDPGASFISALEVTPDVPILGYIGHIGGESGDKEYFTFTLDNSADVWITTVGELDTYGELYDSSQSRIAYQHDGGFEGNEEAFLIMESLEAGTYYLMVRSNISSSGPDEDDTGLYTLYVNTVPDHGSSASTATSVDLHTVLAGNISSATDEDYFRIDLQEDTWLLAWAQSPRPAGLAPTVLDSTLATVDNLTTIEGSAWTDGSLDFRKFTVAGHLPAGAYYIRVNSTSNSVDDELYVMHVQTSVFAEQIRKRCLAFTHSQSDPLYGCQWHLKNTGQLGEQGVDLNVEDVWASTRGAGINVAIIDVSLHYEHPDLRDNVIEARNHDYYSDGVFDPNARVEPRLNHGTGVAGLIAADDNDIGVRGVAPDANIYLYNLPDSIIFFLGDVLEDAMTRHMADTAVSNNSWNWVGVGLGKPVRVNEAWERGVEEGITDGYGGKGVSYVWAAGNGAESGDDSNLDGLTNFYGVITACAVDHKGIRASYSEKGASLWVCAPSHQVTTTTVGRYTTGFGGTSAAAPLVSGVVALMRATNSELTWRDVKLILAASARKNDPDNTGWQRAALQYGSTAERYWFNQEYGFGLVDAKAAVDLADGWTSPPALREVTVSSGPIGLAIPDAPSSGTPTTVTTSINVESTYVTFVEFIEINIDINHDSYRNLQIDLVSPSGAVSKLAELGSGIRSPLRRSFRLGSSRHLGENPDGRWMLRLTDREQSNTGTLSSWSMTVYGHGTTPGAPAITSVERSTTSLTTEWSAPDDTGGSAITSYDLRYTAGNSCDKGSANWTVKSGVWSSGDLSYDLTGVDSAIEYEVQIRAVNDSGPGPWSESEAEASSTLNSTVQFAPSVRFSNQDPSFPSSVTRRTVSESLAVLSNVGAAVAAIDPDGDSLTYSLNCVSDYFSLNASTGQLQLKSALDYETNRSHSFTVQVSDSKDSSGQPDAVIDDENMVTITVDNVNEDFVVSGPAEVSWDENAIGVVATYSATDPEGETMRWRLEGPDQGDLQINSIGQLSFREPPDFEDKQDADKNNQYIVAVLGSAGGHIRFVQTVVEVVDVTEPPVAPAIDTLTPRDGVLALLWSAPSFDGGEPISGYSVRYVRSDALNEAAPPWITSRSVGSEVESGKYEYRIQGLENLVSYAVQVLATNSVGDSEWSSSRSGTPAVQNQDPEFPSSESGERTVAENIAVGANVGARIAATDPDADALTYSVRGSLGPFSLNAATGQLRVAQALDYESATTHTVTLEVTDGKDSNGDADPTIDDTIEVTVEVTNVNELPQITLTSAGVDVTVVGNAVSLNENYDGPLATLTATDPDRTFTDYTLTLGGAHASFFTLNGNELSFTRPPNHEERAQYRLRIAAANATETGTLDVTVTVGDVPERPFITGRDEVTLNEIRDPTPGQVVSVGVYAKSDPDRPLQTTNWGLIGSTQVLSGADSGAFAFDQTTGRLTFASPPDYEAPTDTGGDSTYAVTLNANDGSLGGSFDVTVNVANLEEAGNVSLGAQQGVINVPLTATLTDEDGVRSATWQWQRSTSPTSGWADIASTDASSYTPTAADRDHYLRATVSYEDGHGPDKSADAVTESTTANERTSNTAPVLPDSVDDISLPENAAPGRNVGSPVQATDAEGDDPVYTLSGSPDFVIGRTTGQIQVAEDVTFDYDQGQRSYALTVTADDGFGGTDTVAVTVNIEDVNEAPVVAGEAPRVAEDGTIEIDVLANDSDPENDNLSLLSALPRAPIRGTATVDTTTNRITYTPRANYHGADSFSYRVQDDGSPRLSSTAIVSITVDPVNDAPEFASATVERSIAEGAEEGDSVGAPVAATDIDAGDTLTYRLAGVDSSSFDIDDEGQITVGTGVTFDIATQDTYEVTVTVDDGSGEPNATASVAVTIAITAGPVGPLIFIGGGGGGGPSGPTPSELDFEWTVEHDIEELDSGHEKPSGSWSDSLTLWLLDNPDGAGDAVYAYDLATGERVEDREFDLDDMNRAPRGVWSDRTTVWVSDSGQDRLFAHDIATGERTPARDIELGDRNADPRGIWSDGETMWVLDGGKNALFAYDVSSGALVGECVLDPANDDPRGIWSDHTTVWVSNHDPKRLFAYRLPTREDLAAAADDKALERVREEEFTELSAAGNNSPRGIWSDGDVMYVADENDGRVYTYNMPDAIDARLASLILSGVEIGEFDGGVTEYEGVSDDGVTETTVAAEAVHDGATVAIDPSDGDEETEGHQVDLEGVGEITITVTSPDGSRERAYRVLFGDEAAGPSASCLSGAVDVGFSLVVFGGGSVDDLVACAKGRHVTALYALDEGDYVSHILGAPAFVNERFGELYAGGVPALTPLAVKSNGPATGDPGAPVVTEPWAECLRGEIVEGFSLMLYEGGSVDALAACAKGLEVGALYALNEGTWLSYILGAPEFVNLSFGALYPDGIREATPLTVRGAGP